MEAEAARQHAAKVAQLKEEAERAKQEAQAEKERLARAQAEVLVIRAVGDGAHKQKTPNKNKLCNHKTEYYHT